MFPGVRWSECHINAGARKASVDKNEGVLIGIDRPVRVKLSWLKEKVESIKNGSVGTGHIPFSCHAREIVNGAKVKMIVMVRHPAEVVISQVKYISKSKSHFANDHYKKIGFDESVRLSTVGSTKIGLTRLSYRYQEILNWVQHTDSLLVRFEDLIGERGGGELEAQVRELKRIASYCGVHVCPESIEQLAEGVYGGTHTFEKGRGGKVGGWRDDMSPANLEVLKDEIGDIAERLNYSLMA